jgi:hypothetical protein
MCIKLLRSETYGEVYKQDKKRLVGVLSDLESESESACSI